MSETTSRREVLREQLVRDAKAAARELILTEGLAGLTLAAVARRLGVTSPALYRYFNGRNGLVQAVYDELAGELTDALREAVERQDADDISAQLHAATRAVMTWSVDNRMAFDMLMGSSFRTAASEADVADVIPVTLGALFAKLFTRLYEEIGLKHPADEEIPLALRRQLEVYRLTLNPDLPLGVIYLMITCWRQIYGLVSMAVHQHMSFAFDNHDLLFEDMIDQLLGLIGLQRSPRLRID